MNNNGNRDKELQEQYEEAFFRNLMEGYDEHQGERLMKEAHEHPQPDLSPEQMQNIEKLIRKEVGKQRRRNMLKAIYKRRKQIALFAIVILGMFSITFVTVDAFRSSVLNFFSYDKGSSTVVGIRDQRSGEYAPEYLPEGMTVTQYNDLRDPTHVLLEDKHDKFVNIYISTDESKLHIDTENSESIQTVMINDCEGQLIIKGRRVCLAWHNSNETIYATLNTNLETDEAVKIAKSVILE